MPIDDETVRARALCRRLAEALLLEMPYDSAEDASTDSPLGDFWRESQEWGD